MATKQQAIRLVKNLLIARRNQRLAAEESAHRKLVSFCQQHNCDFEETLAGATQWLKRNSIAAAMNGLF